VVVCGEYSAIVAFLIRRLNN